MKENAMKSGCIQNAPSKVPGKVQSGNVSVKVNTGSKVSSLPPKGKK
jgi:hypothetical protein